MADRRGRATAWTKEAVGMEKGHAHQEQKAGSASRPSSSGMRGSGSITKHIWQEEGVRDMHMENGSRVGGGMGRELTAEGNGKGNAHREQRADGRGSDITMNNGGQEGGGRGKNKENGGIGRVQRQQADHCGQAGRSVAAQLSVEGRSKDMHTENGG